MLPYQLVFSIFVCWPMGQWVKISKLEAHMTRGEVKIVETTQGSTPHASKLRAHFFRVKDALAHTSPLRGGMHRRTHSRTPSRLAHNTDQHMCTPVSPQVEMDGEAANKWRRLEPKPHPASLDFISSLPDDMLLVIIGLLPTKSAVRTALLSRRWRPLWRRVPLNLTIDSYLCDGDCKRMSAVSKILSSHPGPARRLDIHMFSTNSKVQPKFDEWFLSPALDQLKELSFEAGRCRSLPPSALRLTPMMRRASFS